MASDNEGGLATASLALPDMESLLFDFDFGELKERAGRNANERFEQLARRQRRNKSPLGIQPHDTFKVLSKKRLAELMNTARDRLKVGFELEFSGVDFPAVEPKLKELGIITGTKSPLKTVYKKGEFYDSTNRRITIEMPETIDVFKEHELIAYAYEDGSVPLEVVTTAYDLNLFELEGNLRQIYNLVRRISDKATCNCLQSCGLHQTFCFEHKKDSFDKVVIANIFQICRAFSSGILYLFSSGNRKRRTRDMQYRNLNNSVWIHPTVRTSKYSFVNNKNNQLLEFRWVDGCNSPFLSALCALFNYCIIRKAIRLSEFGVLIIDSNFFRKNDAVTKDFISSPFIDNRFLLFNATRLLSFLKRELDEAGIYEYLLCLFKSPMWQRDFDKDSLRSWREQENRIKAVRKDRQEASKNELSALLYARAPALERGGI